MSGLNSQQRAFLDSYLVSRNATQAAIEAGYSEHTAKQQGSRLLTRADIKAALADADREVIKAVEARHEAAKGSAQWIVDEAVRVVLEAENPRDRVPALALLAKRHPEFSEKHEVTGDLQLRVEALAAVATMTPEQLRELASGAR